MVEEERPIPISKQKIVHADNGDVTTTTVKARAIKDSIN
ncbi:MAG: hypothetical protein M2R45_03589 [Verrucomicrobia subdivision 3 bacterium]|nr:hypothetical protein [Limisphaerales bacterium]MCS1414778.1 hypothetical protein [Limisphaerales bacterium]